MIEAENSGRSRAEFIAPTAASLLVLVIGGWCLTRLSPTIDEWAYVQFGVKFWFGGDADWLVKVGTLPFAFWVQNGPGAIYLKLMHGSLPGGLDGNFGKTLMLSDQLRVLWLARWTNLVLTGPSTVWLVWLLTRRHFGSVAATAAAFFCAIEPNLIAGYITATADASILPPCLLLWLLYEDQSKPTRFGKLLLMACLCGLGTALKISMLPIGVLILCSCFVTRMVPQFFGVETLEVKTGRLIRESLRFAYQAGFIVVVGFFVSWALNGFLWDYLLNPESSNNLAYKIAGRLGYSGESADAWVGRLQRLKVPAPIGVFRSQMAHSRGGHPMTFLGVSGPHGPIYYYPYIFLMKTHLVLLGAVLVSLFDRRVWRSSILLMSVLLVGTALTSKIHGGPRYFLVLYALMASMGGLGVSRFLRPIRYRAALIVAVVALAIMAMVLTLRSIPLLYTHTSPLWGGDSEGYRYADANYDWGQGLFETFDAVDRSGLKPVAFWHTGDPHYGVPAAREMITGSDPLALAEAMRGKCVVVGVHLLYHSEIEAPDTVPLQRTLREIGADGRLNDTSFFFDFRSEERYARFREILRRNLEMRMVKPH